LFFFCSDSTAFHCFSSVQTVQPFIVFLLFLQYSLLLFFFCSDSTAFYCFSSVPTVQPFIVFLLEEKQKKAELSEKKKNKKRMYSKNRRKTIKGCTVRTEEKQ
jgi:hypothetical protein